MKPEISVVLTTHEAYKQWLPRAIESVLKQSFKNWELIVVSDGGESRQKIIDRYYDSRIKYILAPKFGSHPRPKNIGTLEAVGDFIAYLDGDNAFRKDHLQALYREQAKSGADVVYGDRLVIDYKTGKSLPGVKSDFSLGLLGKQNYIDTNDVLCRRSAILEVGGWDESLEYFADWNLWVRLAKAGHTFQHLSLLITDYYYHGKNNVLKAEKSGLNFDVQGCKIWPDKTIVGQRPKQKVAIFMLTYDRLNLTIETITSMREQTKYPFDLFVIDNGSTDKTQIWLADNAEKCGIRYKLMHENVGISKGSNVALDMIKDTGDYNIIGKVDNDCGFITEGWLEDIVDVLERSRMSVVSPYVEGLIDHPGGSIRVRNGYIDHHYVGIVEHLGGICCFAPSKIYDTFRWEEKDFLHGMQDSIFSQFAKNLGYILLYLENVRVEHLFNTSFSEKGTELEQPNEREYRERRKKEKVTKYNA